MRPVVFSGSESPTNGSEIPDEVEQGPSSSTVPVTPSRGSDAGRGRGLRLFRIARRNLWRRPEYTVFSIIGIGLSMAVVIVVQGIASGYEGRGAVAVGAVLNGASAWVVPPGGVTYDPEFRAIVPRGTAPPMPALGAGWRIDRLVGGRGEVGTTPLIVYGTSQVPSGSVQLTATAAETLHVRLGEMITVAGQHLTVASAPGPATAAFLPLALGEQVVGHNGWLTVFPPSSDPDFAQTLGTATGLPVTTDPARGATATRGIVYITKGGRGFFTFEQNFAGVLSGKAQSSVLGIVARIALVLGLVIAVSSFLGALQERRREFGIMASVGLTDETLYFFLMESIAVFVAAYLVGVAIGFPLLLLAAPGQVAVSDALTAAGLVLTYLPAMAIIAALVPAHRLLQQRPVDLLREQAA